MSIPSLAPLVAAAAEGKVASQPTGKASWLRCVWLNDLLAPSDVMAWPLMSSLSVTPTMTGEIRSYAGGVDVAIVRVGKRSPVKVNLPHCTRTQLAWLEAHLGRTVCIRDDRGRRLFGVYFAVPAAENRHNLEASVDLDITQVTVAEAV